MKPSINILYAVGPTLRRAMRGHYRPDSCIAASRIGMDLLERLEIPSEAVRVEASLFSPAFAARIAQEGRMPDSAVEREEWVAEGEGLHSVALGFGTADRTPGLHVVLLVAGRYLWDLSVDQASRPTLGLPIPGPLALDLDVAPFKRGVPHTRQANDGTLVTYCLAPDRWDAWRQSNNWRRDGADAAIRAAIVDGLMRGIADAMLVAP